MIECLMPRLLRLSLVAALLCGLADPAAVLQTYAWTRMTLSGLRRGSVARALSETFDGRHPCAICARAGRAVSTPSLRASASARPDLFPPSRLAAPATTLVRAAAPGPRLGVSDSASPPSTPPPKTFLA